jgi:DNA polymerase-4
VARAIREQIRDELALTASAGVAPNKFLAKIASDLRKPDGLYVIQPADVETFLPPLPVSRLPGVGKVVAGKLQEMGVSTCGELRALEPRLLEARLGRYGLRLCELARGIDRSAVQPDRPTLSISAEDTFEHDIPLAEMEAAIRRMAAKTWAAASKAGLLGRTVVLKLKTSDFHILTRSHTAPTPPSSCAELEQVALALRGRVQRPLACLYRLVGVGLANIEPVDVAQPQPGLFARSTAAEEVAVPESSDSA